MAGYEGKSTDNFEKRTKMLTAGFDTSTQVGSIAIVENGAVKAQETIDTCGEHVGGLLPALDDLLKKNRLEMRQVDLLAVGTGPGSYTGCRVGISFARGLAFALEKPLVGVCSLEAIAYGAGGFSGTILVVVDAKIRAYYYGAYRRAGGKIEVVEEPAVCDIEKLGAKKIENAILIGPDNVKLHQKFTELFGDGVEIPRRAFYPDAAYIALRGEKEKLTGKYDRNKTVLPIYLRPSPAEIKLKEEQQKTG